MTMTQHPNTRSAHAPDFTTPEGLRTLLCRLHAGGPAAWRGDPAASALLRHTIEKYGKLALTWRREPADAGYAAFEVMRSPKILTATDPWRVVTRAVQRNIMSEAMGDRLLISAARAKKGGITFDAPTRAGDRDWLYEHATSEDAEQGTADEQTRDEVLRLREAITDIVELLIGLGWPDPETGLAVDYVLSRTGDAGSLGNAREVLRKETDMPARLGLPSPCWPGLLRILLGGKSRPGRPTRKGVLVRLLQYDTIDTLLGDDDLVVEIALAAPSSEHGDG